MLSRVQSLNQLFISVSLPRDKIYSSSTAMEELARLRSVSLNDKKHFKRCIISCNIRSLKAHFKDISSSPHIKNADVICLQETWLEYNTDYGNQLNIWGFNTHFNSVSNGKGVATYFRDHYTLVQEIKRDRYQMTLVGSKHLNIINVYRSFSSDLVSHFIEDLVSLFDDKKKTILAGDLNVCYLGENNHPIIKKLDDLNFRQRVKMPTHVQGRLIDHIYFFSPSLDTAPDVEVLQFGQYFTDHDLMVVDISICGIHQQVC